MANENKFFVGCDTEVQLQGVRDLEDNLLDGTATITGRIANVKDIEFTYDGSDGNFTGIVPRRVQISDGQNYTLVVKIVPDGGQTFTVGITREAAFIEV
jgi:hypothetical protein